jgi:hypothetical protein
MNTEDVQYAIKAAWQNIWVDRSGAPQLTTEIIDDRFVLCILTDTEVGRTGRQVTDAAWVVDMLQYNRRKLNAASRMADRLAAEGQYAAAVKAFREGLPATDPALLPSDVRAKLVDGLEQAMVGLAVQMGGRAGDMPVVEEIPDDPYVAPVVVPFLRMTREFSFPHEKRFLVFFDLNARWVYVRLPSATYLVDARTFNFGAQLEAAGRAAREALRGNAEAADVLWREGHRPVRLQTLSADDRRALRALLTVNDLPMPD